MLHIDLEVGQTVQIDGYTVTILDVQDGEVFVQVDDTPMEECVTADDGFSRVPR